MSRDKNYNLTVTNFKGVTLHFFDRIKTLSTNYTWSPDVTIMFFRDKLTGPAL